MISSIIPENINGKSLDIQEQVIEESVEKAIKTFERGCARLVNPPVWHLIAGALSAKFILYNPDKINNIKLVEVNDYFMIDIPGPGISVGDGYDWVKIEALQQNTETDCDASIAMRLRASKNPNKSAEGVAHFFNDQATSTFIIKRNGKMVSASYHGRNEIVNTRDIPLTDKIRNEVIATGAKAGLSNLQWRALIKGFLQPEIVDSGN